MRTTSRIDGQAACARSYDADFVADVLARGANDDLDPDVVGHVRACASCARTARELELVRAAWRAGRERDEQFTRGASERRLAVRWQQPRRAVWPLALTAVLVAALLGAWWAPAGRGARAGLGAESRTRPQTGLQTAHEALAQAVTSPEAVTPAVTSTALGDRPRALVVARSCAKCNHDVLTPVHIGDRLVADSAVRVPRGATLALNWAFDASLLDGRSTVDVDGPAIVRASDSDSGVAVVLDEGVAHAEARLGGRADVETLAVRTGGQDAAWTVSVRSGKTQIVVERGEVVVHTATQQSVVGPGESVLALADGRLLAASAVVDAPAVPVGRGVAPQPAVVDVARDAPGPSDEVLWQRAQAALRDGDRHGASDAMRALSQSASDRTLRDRASFGLAEIELAQGKSDDARGLLWPLLDAPDASLAGDAAFLLARSSSTPSDRAEVLAQYLSKPRPTPYREQAMVERAGALLASGDESGGRAIVRALRAEPNLPAVAQTALVRLERALQK